jgi:Ca2+-binding RTX toxin-like protein
VPIQLTAFDIDLTDSLTYSIESQLFNGEILSFDPSTGSLVYQPNPNFNGNDSFLFKAVDQGGLESNIATVQITVNPVNDPPVAVDKMVETNSTTPVSITLEGTDIDQADTINSFTIISISTNGQLSDFNSNAGTLTYTPNNNFVGQDSFTFKVTDSNGLESINNGSVTINVKSLPNNEQPPPPLPSSVCIDSDSTVKPKGTQGNDELVGTSQRDVITGLAGNDRFNGCSGNDTLNGNIGNDGIAGGPGNDRLHGNEGNDYLQGDSGIDFLFGNEGNDILVGNEGIDQFSCGSGQDQILDFDALLDIKSNDCEEF